MAGLSADAEAIWKQSEDWVDSKYADLVYREGRRQRIADLLEGNPEKLEIAAELEPLLLNPMHRGVQHETNFTGD